MSKLKAAVEDEDRSRTLGVIFQLALMTMMAEPMLKYKKRAKKPKTARPCRYINPGQSHTARIYPRQTVRVVLDPPSGKVSEEAHWEIDLNCPYLVLTKKYENRKGQEVYEFTQIYDLTEWAKYSEVYLGEIHYNLVNNTHEKANEGPKGGTLKVYLIPKENNGKHDVLTLVNPDQYVVKVQPHRTLEVVLFEDWAKGHLDDWTVEIAEIPVCQQAVFLKEVAKTWVADNHEQGIHSGYNIVSRHTPTVNSKLDVKIRDEVINNLESRPKPAREHHFWFQFDTDSRRRIGGVRSGDYEVAKLKFTGRCVGIPDKSVTYEVIVVLSIHGKPVKIEDAPMSVEDARKRVLNRQQHILTNPGFTDQIDFSSSINDYVIEIIHPKHLWDDEPDEARWEIDHDNALKDTYLNFVSIPALHKNGVCYQRFRVMKKDLGGKPEEHKMLGAIRISYPNKRHIDEATRRIALWLAKDTPTIRSNTSSSTNSNRSYNRSFAGESLYGCTSSCSSGGDHWKNGLGRYTQPKRSKVLIEELALAPLEENAKTIKLCDVRQYDDEEAYYAHMSAWAGRGYTQAKKNYPTAGQSQTWTAAGVMPAETTTSTGTTDSTRTATSTSRTTTPGTEEEVILFNPVNYQEVMLSPGKVLVLRLAQPEDMVFEPGKRDKLRNKLWSIIPQMVGDIRPIIEDSDVSKLSTTKYRQEVRIKINEAHFPDSAGTWTAGALVLKAGPETRIIRLHYKKGETTSTLALPKLDKPVKNIVCHEAAGRKYEFAAEWKHDEAVLLDPETFFYVMNPANSQEWPGEWSVYLSQHPIEPRIWDKLSPNVTNLVDRHRPWYKRDMPAHLNRTMYFKPLAMSCNADITRFLKELAQATKAEYYPVASLTYENNKKAYVNSDSSNGSVEKTERCRRRLHLYVKLPKLEEEYKGQSSTFEPQHGDNINVRVKDEFTIRIPNITTKDGLKRWRPKEYPGFVDYQGISLYGKDVDAFRFTVNKEGSDSIYFHNSLGQVKAILVTAVK